MKKQAFNNALYLQEQSKHIMERISQFGNKLYLEFGGKLFDDYHASRVLPGFQPDSKLKMLLTLSQHVEIVIAICAKDIENTRIRSDLGITYEDEVLRLIDAFRASDLFVGSVVITQYANQNAADKFKQRVENLGVSVSTHYPIDGYPNNVGLIVSDAGYGKNDFIETSKSLVVVTAPGPGSGKMAVCLSQLFHEHKRGRKAGYAKFETFPVWNLPLEHPVNLAYEAATADLNDINMIDPFHLEAYGETSINYNRDVKVFPVLNNILSKIMGDSIYKSPTDMGVNWCGYCIEDDEAARLASKEEILRRYYHTKLDYKLGYIHQEAIEKIEILMSQAKISTEERSCAIRAMQRAEETNAPAVAIELENRTIVSGRTTSLLGASAAALLNALKVLANIDDKIHLISPEIIKPIQHLKVHSLGNNNPRLHTDEILIALAISATQNETAKCALAQLDKLQQCEIHSSVILSQVDINTIKKLGMNLTCEDQYQTKKLYHAK
ncbi:MAG: DUF1846 domain-containing protein [Breznakia sp.]